MNGFSLANFESFNFNFLYFATTIHSHWNLCEALLDFLYSTLLIVGSKFLIIFQHDHYYTQSWKEVETEKKGRQPTKPKMSSTDDGDDSLSMLQHNMEEEDRKLPASDEFYNISSFLDEIGEYERINDDNNGRSQAQLSVQNDRSRRYNQAQKATVDDFMTTLEKLGKYMGYFFIRFFYFFKLLKVYFIYRKVATNV